MRESSPDCTVRENVNQVDWDNWRRKGLSKKQVRVSRRLKEMKGQVKIKVKSDMH